ncbi:hypothetical protein HK097_010555 [Rhizophlyctis rosea]|uniref:Uncharacterized protein n=1 Tax=Rhizophlyctis rosea TaxID=64517 RepID=A0AAD5SAP1_9FUNG|nr:hypothetical protein HK097_010555 [Rhizophlyctis rosea]
MEGSLENFIQEQSNPDPVSVAVNRGRLDIIAGLDRARDTFVTVTDPIYLFHRGEGPNVVPRGVTTHIDAVKIPRVPFTKERRIGDSVYHDQVLARDRIMGDGGSGPGGGKSAAQQPLHRWVHIDTDLFKLSEFRDQTTPKDLEKLSEVRRKQLGEEIEMFDRLIATQRNFTEAVGGHLERPVERILGPTVSRDTQTLVPVGINGSTQTPILATSSSSSQTITPIPTVQGTIFEGMDIDAGVASSSRNPPPLRGSRVIPTVQGVLNRTFVGGGLARGVRHGQLGAATLNAPRRPLVQAGPAGGSRRSSLPGYEAMDEDPVAFVDRLNPPPAYQFGNPSNPPQYFGPALGQPRTG